MLIKLRIFALLPAASRRKVFSQPSTATGVICAMAHSPQRGMIHFLR